MNNRLKKIYVVCLMLIFSLSLMPNIVVKATANGAPGKGSLQTDQWGEDVDGNYNITVTMWYGNNGTSYVLYERFGLEGEFTPVAEGTLTDNSPNVQSFVIPITGREKNGLYYYYIELINSYGKSQGDIISVQVGGGEYSNIILDGIDNEKSEYQFTVNQGVTDVNLYNKKKENTNFSVMSSNTSIADVSIVDGTTLRVNANQSGRSGLKIIDNVTGDIRHVGLRVRKSNGDLPGLPDYVSLGQVSEDTKNDLDFWRDISNDDKNKRVDIRYIYINGGPESGWRTWTTEDGGRAKKYIAESLKLGMIPYFVFYNIPDSSEDYNVDLRHINDKSYMEKYYEDLMFFLEIIDEYAKDEVVGIVLEPDFLGYMMQQSGKRPAEIEALGVEGAYTSGVLVEGKDPKFDNTVKGVVESINYIISRQNSNITFGWQFNTWGYAEVGVPSQGLMHATEYMGWEKGREFIKNAAEKTAQYYMEAGILSYGADFISIDKYGLDGAYEDGAANNPANSKWLWNADLWNNYLYYTKALHETTNKPVTLWQLPVGHLNESQENNPYSGGLFPNLQNTVGKYEDSAPTYFFGDTFKPGNGLRFDYFKLNNSNDPKVKVNGDTITYGSHIEEARDAGVTTMLFGAGVGASTDCVGVQPADSFWWITKAQRYYKDPVMLNKTPIEQFEKEDLNKDGVVNILDLSLISKLYNCKNTDHNYNSSYDLKRDGIIDIYDLVIVSKKIQ